MRLFVVSMTLALCLITHGAGAATSEDRRTAGFLRSDCAGLTGPRTGAFPRLLEGCRNSCGDFLNSDPGKVGDQRMADLLQQCWRYRDDALSYLQGSLYKDGTHYSKLPVRQTTTSLSGTEVILFTTLACGRCLYERDAFVAWSRHFPNVTVRMLPLTWGYSKEEDRNYDAYAQVDVFCATLADAQLAAKVRRIIADSVTTAPLRHVDEVRPRLLAAGVDAKSLEGLDSFAVKARMQQATEMTRRYRVAIASSYAVNGTYLVPPPDKISLLLDSRRDIVQFLVERETGLIGGGARSP